MRYRELALAIFVAAVTGFPAPPAAYAAHAGALIQIEGTVVRVDPAHRRLILRHAPLETAPAGVRVCFVADRRELQGIKAGASITALADTSRREWRLQRVQLQY